MAKSPKPSSAVATLPLVIRSVVQAARSKKAADITVLDLRKAGAFADYFVICSGQTTRQVKAIVEAIEEALRKDGVRPSHVEGYERAEWVLLDCFDFIVHVFTPHTRAFYGLERLWGAAVELDLSQEDDAPRSSGSDLSSSPTRKTRRVT